MLVYFPAFVLSVDTSSDCHLSYKPLGRSALLDTLQYVQPRCPPLLYPAKLKASSNTITQSSRLIEDDKSKDNCSSRDVQDEAVVADKSLFFQPLSLDPGSILAQLCSLANSVQQLAQPVPSDMVMPAILWAPVLLSALPLENVLVLYHHPNTTLPTVCPCNTTNALDTKMHWSGEELHRIMGHQKFHNYKHILAVSRDGKCVDGGGGSPFPGSFTTQMQ